MKVRWKKKTVIESKVKERNLKEEKMKVRNVLKTAIISENQKDSEIKHQFDLCFMWEV